MSNALKLLFPVLLCALCLPAQTAIPDKEAKPLVLQKNEGELRTRKPREGVSSPSTDFLLKIGPKTSGSKHLLLFTEELVPGAAIPKHKHHGEEEIILVQTGNAHVWLGDKEYDAHAGAIVFIPAETWISLKNTGTENSSLVAVWNEPGFEEMLLCGSVPKGQVGEKISRDAVQDCYHHGDAELAPVQSSADKTWITANQKLPQTNSHPFHVLFSQIRRRFSLWWVAGLSRLAFYPTLSGRSGSDRTAPTGRRLFLFTSSL